MVPGAPLVVTVRTRQSWPERNQDHVAMFEGVLERFVDYWLWSYIILYATLRSTYV